MNDTCELLSCDVQERRETSVDVDHCPTDARVIYDKIEDFVGHVIYDGRFLGCFTADPEAIADRLDVEITPEVAANLRGRDRGQVLAAVTEEMTRRLPDQEVRLPQTRAAVVLIVGVVVIGIAAVVGGKCILAAVSRYEPQVVDDSSDRDSKI